MATRVAALAVFVLAAAVTLPPRDASAGRPSTPRVTRGPGARVGYYWRKLREMPRPDRSVALAGVVRVLARATGRVRPTQVRLDELFPAHGIPNEAIARKIHRRATSLAPHVGDIRVRGTLPLSQQDRLIPSKGPIRVVRHRGGYVVLDGNSRLYALRRALGSRSAVRVEVDLIDTRSSAVTRLVDRLLRMRGLPAPR